MKGPASWRKTPEQRAATFGRIAATRRAKMDALAPAMAAAYERTGKSLSAVGREFHSDKGTVKYILQRNGYPVRAARLVARQANGSPVRAEPLSPEALDALVAAATKIAIPSVLSREWRTWPLARRAGFIERIRTKLASGEDRPTTPFSSNVTPFAYGTEEAHAIMRKLNAGRDSRTKAAQIKPSSQGVIYNGQLFYWVHEGGTGVGAYYSGHWSRESGRPALHRMIWEEANGRSVPKGHVIRHADGNRNNLEPGNLILATQNDVARENQAAHLLKQSRRITALLLNRSQEKNDTHETRLLSTLSAGQRAL